MNEPNSIMNEQPVILESAFENIVRWILNLVLGFVGSFALAHKLLTQEQLDDVINSPHVAALTIFIAGTLATLFWTYYSNRANNTKALIAKELPPSAKKSDIQKVYDATTFGNVLALKPNSGTLQSVKHSVTTLRP